MKVLLRCGDSDTGCGEGLTHMSAHTRTLRVTERELRPLGHRTLHTSLSDQRREAWSDHRGPVTRPRRKPGEADGGAGQAGQAWADWGEGCHW